MIDISCKHKNVRWVLEDWGDSVRVVRAHVQVLQVPVPDGMYHRYPIFETGFKAELIVDLVEKQSRLYVDDQRILTLRVTGSAKGVVAP